MKYENNKVTDLKIAYIGGGSRGWAWGLMSDLLTCEDICGTVSLYDIDKEAALANQTIGNMYSKLPECKSPWKYEAVDTAKQALEGADFVIISILPGTFDEMESDVHEPEKYGIYQSVGDTAGPGGIVRAMRTVPMFEEIAENIKAYAPKAWVINYTNPMTLCVRTLYRVFPEIKAFGCCHEVFGTQKFLAAIVKETFGLEEDVKRNEILVNPVGVNHFTWITEATWRNVDLFPIYKKFCESHPNGYSKDGAPVDKNWMNNFFSSEECVKMDLFRRFGYIAAAGDRHLAEFCEGKWYLESPERVAEMHFGLTPVSWRKGDLETRLQKSREYLTGERPLKIRITGEEGVHQMRALLGLCDFVTNVNIPNRGQIPNLPLGAVVETNARFCADTVKPLFAGEIPASILPLIHRASAQQEALNEAIAARDLEQIFCVFANDPLVTCGMADARKLFDQMCENTKKYLGSYGL